MFVVSPSPYSQKWKTRIRKNACSRTLGEKAPRTHSRLHTVRLSPHVAHTQHLSSVRLHGSAFRVQRARTHVFPRGRGSHVAPFSELGIKTDSILVQHITVPAPTLRANYMTVFPFPCSGSVCVYSTQRFPTKTWKISHGRNMESNRGGKK